MNTNVFLLFFLSFSVFLQIDRERERGYIKLGISRNSPKVYLSYFDGFLWRIFLLLRAFLVPGVLGFSSVRHESCPTTNFSLFLFSLTGRRCHFRLRVPANYLASTFFLPVSGDPREFTEYQHLLVSTLTHILYFDGLLLLIPALEIVVILFLSSQWDTTWHILVCLINHTHNLYVHVLILYSRFYVFWREILNQVPPQGNCLTTTDLNLCRYYWMVPKTLKL